MITRYTSLAHTTTHVYFLGIGGIGMSALARFFRAKGYHVAGYDHTETDLTRNLTNEQITVNYEDSADAIPEAFRNVRHTLVIYTPAVPTTLPQYQYFVAHKFALHKRSEVLGMITRDMRALCVAGTHGKTTTSTMLAHLLYQSEVGCNAFLGGISNNYSSNLLLSQESSYVVVEADEFDRSFHQLSPFMSIVTSMDPDHLDIYGTEEAYQESFVHYISLIKPGGALIINDKLMHNSRFSPVEKIKAGVKVYTYAVNEEADFYADNIIIEKGRLFFDFHTPSEVIGKIQLGVPVFINVENSVAAMAVAWLNGVKANELRLGLASYAGIYRRFNISSRLTTHGSEQVLVDDYAHHPTEIAASIASVRMLYPNKRITGVFQPHLFTRTRDFADEFAAALSALDEIILLPIYPAREEPIEGVNSEMLLEKITCPKKRMIAKGKAAQVINSEEHEVVLTIGAGDISQVAEELKQTMIK